jgi:hypothetical protein
MKNGDTILYEDKLHAARLVGLLENHISKRDGLAFEFEGAARVKELKLAYSLIDRAKAYLARQIDVGLSALEFCMEIVELILSNPFWGKVVQSIAMFMRHVSSFAKEVFLKHKESVERRDRDDELSTFADFFSYSGVEPCYQAANT